MTAARAEMTYASLVVGAVVVVVTVVVAGGGVGGQMDGEIPVQELDNVALKALSLSVCLSACRSVCLSYYCS